MILVVNPIDDDEGEEEKNGRDAKESHVTQSVMRDA